MSVYEILANDLGIIGNLHGTVGENCLKVIWLRFEFQQCDLGQLVITLPLRHKLFFQIYYKFNIFST